jgi:hypothetical protein
MVVSDSDTMQASSCLSQVDTVHRMDDWNQTTTSRGSGRVARVNSQGVRT